ncbi:hypothetical protein MtrunA17_Chr7g0253401 [Medicago truncatula]|uniref:Transmembrane protein, putative n=1 Tax=Medicago truncatula TaxID=3880 RepID=G7KZH2_MEDTR|nr:transmembrane protein, putative [Medicago truncatula]RHN47473.1 hypothetical protein MtrunA17_Chr7g0253401 [Medicago truncatula]
MDINEWVILSDDGFFDGDEKQIFLDKRNSLVFDKDYFCTSPKSTKIIDIEPLKVPKQVFHVPIQFEPIIDKVPNEGLVKENTEKIKVPQIEEADQESVSQVFFHIKENKFVDMYYDEKEGEDMNGGFNLWKWSLTGVGAICSFGVAAATICVLFFGSQQRNNKLQQDQSIRFKIYTDDKVVQHTTKLNEAFAAVRGVPLSRAHITYGGYYDSV